MSVDRYTKAVLTVIAGCLLWMCVMGAGQALQAQRRDPDRDVELAGVNLKTIKTIAQPVIIVGTGVMDREGNVEVLFTRRDARTDPTLSVRLPYSPANPMAVEISAVKKTGEWDPLRTDVQDVPFRLNPGPRR
jgi:hypothetical protein